MPPYINDYNETVNYLYALQRHGIKLGLENPGRLMSILGEPQKSFRSVHIAGTNGKGSTAAMIASILKNSGFKVGLYTSPHLVSFTERVSINNEHISETEVTGLTSHIRNAIAGDDIKPTFFEFVTAMAFYYFASKRIEWAVVEVGMGGRLDATNVLLPDVSVITNVSLDHNEFLGETIFDIATEKAGIIKPSIPVVTATTHPEALRVLEETARDLGSELHVYDKDFKGSLLFMDDKHILFNYSGMNLHMGERAVYQKYNSLSLPAPGKHQLYNASVAIRVCEILAQKGVPITSDAINNGFLYLNFEGRLECISRTPLIILDSAHNPEAARALSESVKEIFPEKKIILVAGIMKDKDIGGILKPLLQISNAVILTKPKSERAASPDKLETSIETMDERNNKGLIHKSIRKTRSVSEAIELAKSLWHKEDIILVTGSFYTTGEAKELLGHVPGVLSQLREEYKITTENES